MADAVLPADSRRRGVFSSARAILFKVTLLCMLPVAQLAIAQTAGNPAPRTGAAKAERGTRASDSLHIAAVNTGWEFHAVAVTPSAPSATTPDAVLKDHLDIATWRAASVPGTVHTDLAAAGIIPPPFVGDNEKRLQWIGLVDWEYRTQMTVTPAQLQATHAELIFDGLDTFADVSLNGAPLLKTDNMFRSYTANVQGKLHVGENTLTILFHSPVNTTAPQVAKLPYILPGTGYEPLDKEHGIYPVGQYQRKAGYHYGWDWGPRFVTSGVFRPIHLDTWSGDRVRSLHVEQTSVTKERVIATAMTTIDADTAGPAELSLALTTPDGQLLPARVEHVELDRGRNVLSLPLRLDRPALWWPAGYGAQARYLVTAKVMRAGRPTGGATLKTGFRSVVLQRQPDRWGTSFAFVVNGVPVFAKGANVVPLDSFPPSTTDAKKRDLLTSTRDANMNMLRIWGGGFYETDSFYDLCDELGLMIWHDFMFGGGMVPGDKAFDDNVKAEADEQVTRLSDHPAMTLWNGNNEVETAWNHWDGQRDFIASISPDQRERVWQDYVVMFRDILKSSVAEHGNGVPYWPSSPSANFEDVAGNEHNGDTHSWSVWSAGAPPADYAKQTPRFLSEFGFQSLPDLRTMQSVVGENTDLDSPEVANHERFVHGFTRMREYLATNFLPARDFPSTIYLSQLLQAEAIRVAVDHARANRPQTMGTLFWQLDDCWPVASWASLDYFGRWKALQYWARKFYAPITIAPELDEPTHTLRVHVVSDETESRSAVLHVRLLHFDGTLLATPDADQHLPIEIAPLASTPVQPINVGAMPGFDARTTVAVLTLELAAGSPAGANAAARSNLALDSSSDALTAIASKRSRQVVQPAILAGPTVANSPGSPSYPLIPSAEVNDPTTPTTLAERTISFTGDKQLALSEPHVTAHLERDATGYTVTLAAESLAVAVELSFGNLNWKLSDNYFDLMPGDRKSVHLTSTATIDQLETAMHVRSLYTATTH